jgi:GntR family transcriptional repressor for pyruvate dehydrogenase complex
MDLVDARCHLEEVIAGLAGVRRTDADLDALRRHMGDMEASQTDTPRFVEADKAFHAALAAASGNGTLQRIMSSIASLLGVWIGRVMTQETNFTPTIGEHHRLLAALEAGDPDAARAAAAAHMARARARLERSLGENGEFDPNLTLGSVA